ncbi:hypothetical protein Tco_0065171 [Tanacetum coccineum]
MASEGSDPDAEYALSKLLQRGTLKARFYNEQLLSLSSYNFRVGLWESLSKARYKEARLSQCRKKLNIEEKIDIVLSWPSEEAPPVIEGVWVGGDELDRVIPALKDGGGEIDGRLDEINLNLSEELADNGVSPLPTSFMAHQSPRVRQLWERIGIGNDHGLMDNGRKHKFVQPNVWGWGGSEECYNMGSGRRKNGVVLCPSDKDMRSPNQERYFKTGQVVSKDWE